jgi:hypothetical protein
MKTGVLVVAGVAAVALGIADTAYRTRHWGAYAREIGLTLPGDGLVRQPAESVTRGVTVLAPADQVWRWVEQVAQVRGGVELAPGHSMVLLDGPGGEGPGGYRTVCSFHVLPMDPPVDRTTGLPRCRLVTRSRSVRTTPAGRLASTVLEPVNLLMTRRMLLGIKERAERSARDGEQVARAG